ncbi:porin family protein [Mucilaginibacter sp. UR6-11]|uniref:porin family protein n=1 Tax=Mucilaginibacter sp. UR6-11 TaxID=1435644 RepID=UPI001E5E763A|nr:porin family protein [Mucilaginibacter sp. UR6-11]MCC8426990.1 PorT family protein [Mucilaginibacter sp. UR6-11]
MKKLLLTLTICLAAISFSNAQVLPSFQFGVKGGINLTSLSKSGTFNTSNQAGYLGGVWARFGALGFNFQPEAYITSKNVTVDGIKAKFTSVDVPLLFGGKIGAFGFGGRFYTGPVVSFAINKDQNYNDAASKATSLDYKDQNYAWQIGAGADIRSLSVDLRYEAGLSKQNYGAGSTRINLFNLSLAYKLF